MSLGKREFLRALGCASAAGLALGSYTGADAATAQRGLYDIPRFGQVSLLHMTDCHAQLLPLRFREPSVNIGVGGMQGRPPHLVGPVFRPTRCVRSTACQSPSSARRLRMG